MKLAMFTIGFFIFLLLMLATTFTFWPELSIMAGAGVLMGYGMHRTTHMRKYLIIKSLYKGTYTTHVITREDLLKVKNREIEQIINIDDCTYFDAEKNSWEAVTKE